jgi:hypothetical protein
MLIFCRNLRKTVAADLTQTPKLPLVTSESAASGAAESPPAEEQICSSAGGGVKPRRGAPKDFRSTGFGPGANSENRSLGLILTDLLGRLGWLYDAFREGSDQIVLMDAEGNVIHIPYRSIAHIQEAR